MNVRKLIEHLQGLDQRRVVVLSSSDGDGMSFRPLEKSRIMASNTSFHADNRQVGLEYMTDNIKEIGGDEDDILHDGVPAVVFY